jgi:catechol 2,3-dioxygenase-like lactoylglutathione lyase family enzyme
MITRTILGIVVLISAAIVQAEETKLDKLPLQPGAYRVDGKSDGFCRLGPGGKSLVLESPEMLGVFTVEDGKYRADIYGADGVSRFEGGLDGAALVLIGAGKLALVPENGAVTLRLETAKQKKAAKWTRVTSAATGVATGIGGVFMRAKDAKKLREWYQHHLGLPLSEYGFVDIRWRELADPARIGHTIWATFKPESTHFDGAFMVNYRVDHLDVLMKKLEKEGVKIERTEDEPGNGRFAWIRDGEGHLVELWEPPADH